MCCTLPRHSEATWRGRCSPIITGGDTAVRSRKSGRPNLPRLVEQYLAELEHANCSPHTRRGYASDLGQFVAFHGGDVENISPDVLRDFGATCDHLAPATRARKQAVLSSFLTWAYRQNHIPDNPMLKLERVRRNPPAPRGLPRAQVERILAVIPSPEKRDRLLFRLIFETGLRVAEALAVHVDDLDLTQDDEHLVVMGKGNKRRTLLLDDNRLVSQLRGYLKLTGYQHGYLFRARINGRGGPLRYQSVYERWIRYCAAVGIDCTLHQLRHSHATEMVNGGVSLGTIRKRLGHKSIQTTLLYAEETDETADAELRAWRRRQVRQPARHKGPRA